MHVLTRSLTTISAVVKKRPIKIRRKKRCTLPLHILVFISELCNRFHLFSAMPFYRSPKNVRCSSLFIYLNSLIWNSAQRVTLSKASLILYLIFCLHYWCKFEGIKLVAHPRFSKGVFSKNMTECSTLPKKALTEANPEKFWHLIFCITK